MSHIFRFFGHETYPCKWSLDPEELEHIRKVLRLKIGDRVEVMDGKGLIAKGHLTEISKDQVLIETAIESQSFVAKAPIQKAIALGALKPGDVDDILTELVELGINEIHIFQQADTAKYRTGDKPRERWQRLIRSAMKQCKTAWSPNLVVHESFEVALKALSLFQRKFVLDADANANLINTVTSSLNFQSVAVIVGSERGLTTEELKLCNVNGFEAMRMGPHILRARTAAITAAGILSALDTSSST